MCCFSRPPPFARRKHRLAPGTAVVVEGLLSQPEWNGKRGLVLSFDEERGRYRLLVKGRAALLGVRLECCRLESMVEQERKLRAAARRAEIEQSVRVALEARCAAAASAEPVLELDRSAP